MPLPLTAGISRVLANGFFPGVKFNVSPTNLFDNGYSTAQAGYYDASPLSRARLTTDATSITVVGYTTIFSTTPAVAKLGVRIDGVDYTTLAFSSDGSQTFNLTGLPAGSKQIEVITGAQERPSSTILGSYITSIAANNGTFSRVQNPTASNRLVVIGDSIANGYLATNPTLQGWAALLRSTYAGNVMVEGVGYGALNDYCDTAPHQAAFVSRIAGYAPSKIWLALGTNDYGLNAQSAAGFGTQYASLLDALHTALPGVTIYCQKPIPRTTETANTFGNTLDNYRSQIVTAVSTRTGFSKLVTLVLTTADLSDGVHPTTAGHATYAQNVLPYAQPLTPTVTSISPTSGANSGTTSVTITGTNFQFGAVASIGATSLTNVTVVSGTSITATVPSGISAGTYDVTVTNLGGGVGTLTNGYSATAGSGVTDTFPEANGTAINGKPSTAGGVTWASFGPIVAQVQSGALETVSGTAASAAGSVVECGSANGTLQIDLVASANGEGLVVNYIDSNNYYLIQRTSGGFIQVYKNQAGTFTNPFQVGGQPTTANHTLKVVKSGNVATIYLDGVSLGTGWNDSFGNTATKHGVWYQNVGIRLDNFSYAA